MKQLYSRKIRKIGSIFSCWRISPIFYRQIFNKKRYKPYQIKSSNSTLKNKIVHKQQDNVIYIFKSIGANGYILNPGDTHKVVVDRKLVFSTTLATTLIKLLSKTKYKSLFMS